MSAKVILFKPKKPWNGEGYKQWIIRYTKQYVRECSHLSGCKTLEENDRSKCTCGFTWMKVLLQKGVVNGDFGDTENPPKTPMELKREKFLRERQEKSPA